MKVGKDLREVRAKKNTYPYSNFQLACTTLSSKSGKLTASMSFARGKLSCPACTTNFRLGWISSQAK